MATFGEACMYVCMYLCMHDVCVRSSFDHHTQLQIQSHHATLQPSVDMLGYIRSLERVVATLTPSTAPI